MGRDKSSSKKKKINSINFLRQKIKSKNLNYSFFRFDKEKSIELFHNGGWHFNNILTPGEISLKLKTFAHSEFSKEEFYNKEVIKKKINDKIDLFDRGHQYRVINFDQRFPKYLLENKKKFEKFLFT